MRRAALRPVGDSLGVMLALAMSMVCACSTTGLAASDDERVLQGLRERRQFELAEKYCSDRLFDSQLSEARRVELVIELSRTLAEHAAASAPAACGIQRRSASSSSSRRIGLAM